AWKLHDPFSPLVAATLGAAITTWTTFLPSFLWIFVGAPWVERLRSIARLSAALSAITAAVVGVILNLAIWFGLHVLLPHGQPPNWFGVVVFAVALAGLTRWKWDVVPVVLGAGVAGAVWRAVH
ncbi:MAG: chromate transporter, partial [bacterium]